MVLCDIGNTTFHFKLKNKDFRIGYNKKLPKIKDKIYFISVNKKATKKFLKKYPDSINIENKIKFKTKYKGMGIDRKIACLSTKDGIIVDVGSAITVDIMKNGKHKGGFILPGLQFFIKLYPSISKKLKFKFSKYININKIPLNTNDAINYAIFQSIILPIKEVSKGKKIIFTGGDGLILSKYFENSIYNKYQVFDNMII